MQSIPDQPGIYVAIPNSETPVPVTQDPRYVRICAKVDMTNVKVGKAKSLRVRASNYERDFGTDAVRFVPIFLTQDIARAETTVLRRLKNYRMRSPKGGLMDWLERLPFEAVVAEALQALDESGIPGVKIPL